MDSMCLTHNGTVVVHTTEGPVVLHESLITLNLRLARSPDESRKLNDVRFKPHNSTRIDSEVLSPLSTTISQVPAVGDAFAED
jgi:hypothetical protein